MPTAKTSVSDPLCIAMVAPDGTQGRIGITLCPGKTDNTARFGPWARDLDLDLDVIQHWGATALISLIEDQEFDRLSVRGLGNAVEHRHMEWWHLPIPDGSPPGPVFETAWGDAGGAIRDRLRSGLRRADSLPGWSGSCRDHRRPTAGRTGHAPGRGGPPGARCPRARCH